MSSKVYIGKSVSDVECQLPAWVGLFHKSQCSDASLFLLNAHLIFFWQTIQSAIVSVVDMTLELEL